jgi:hypothetical protein
MYCSFCNKFDNKYARKYLWHVRAPRDFLIVYILFFFFNLKENPSTRDINIVQHSSVAMRRDFHWLQGITRKFKKNNNNNRVKLIKYPWWWHQSAPGKLFPRQPTATRVCWVYLILTGNIIIIIITIIIKIIIELCDKEKFFTEKGKHNICIHIAVIEMLKEWPIKNSVN